VVSGLPEKIHTQVGVLAENGTFSFFVHWFQAQRFRLTLGEGVTTGSNLLKKGMPGPYSPKFIPLILLAIHCLLRVAAASGM
jgi:hypothetical protein